MAAMERSSVSQERTATPVLIPGRGNLSTVGVKSCGVSMPVTRNTSFATLSGSYIGSVMLNRQLMAGDDLDAAAASVRRKASLTLRSPPSPLTERKLSRTRRMSTATNGGQAAASLPPAAGGTGKMRIPIEPTDITSDWVRLILNQYMLKHDRPLVARADSILDFRVTNCKTSVGDFSSTYKVN